MDVTTSVEATTFKPKPQPQPQRPNPISLRAQSNVETKAAARKGLLNIMMNKFSSTPLSLHDIHEFNNHSDAVQKEMMKLRHQRVHSTSNDKESGVDQYMRNELDMYQYDASLTKSERDYIRHIILSGDTNSIQTASVVLQNEDVFPVQQQLVVSKSSSNATTASASTNYEANGYEDDCGDLSVIANEEDDETIHSTDDDYYKDEKKEDAVDVQLGTDIARKIDSTNTVDATDATPPPQQPLGVRDSMIQQQLFRLHETNKDLQPNELIQRMSRQNSILTMDDSTTTVTTTGNMGTSMSSFRHYRSMSPPPITEGEVLLVSTRSLDIKDEMTISTTLHTAAPTDSDSTHHNAPISVVCAVTSAATDLIESEDTNDKMRNPKSLPVSLHENVLNVDATIVNSSWNPFDDISSWLDGSQGVEVTATTSSQSTAHVPTVDITHTSPLEGMNTTPSNLSVEHNIINPTTTITTATVAAQQPFRILGTSADDVSCHPHVLSPPLMESLLAFVPEYHSHHHFSSSDAATSGTFVDDQHLTPETNNEKGENAASDVPSDSKGSNKASIDCQQFNCQSDTTTSNNEASSSAAANSHRQKQFAASSLIHSSMSSNSSSNFWLKYSLVRDGPGLWTFLRQVRASAICILAIETTEGHVLGAYTSQPWRLSKGWYGNKDTFLWKMRRSRLETAGKSILQQICQESEIQVYPYRAGNVAVQYCSNKCLMLGQGEVIPSPKKHNPDKPPPSRNVGKHYGYALYLDKELTSGTTSSSETFGNPCLLDSTLRGARFNVANIEVWTLTPHTTVADAEQSELSNLFLDGGRDGAHRLNFMNILVGGPI